MPTTTTPGGKASRPGGPERLGAAGLAFLAERHLATLTSIRADGSPHVTPVGFTWDAGRNLARVICGGGSVKARLAGGPVALCQVDGRYWLTLEGPSRLSRDAAEVAEAVERYARRYRQPRHNPERVVIEIAVDRVLGHASLLT